MSKIKALGTDTLIIGLGNFGSKFMLFFMVPFYTYFLTPKNYGIADMLFVAVSMLTPLLSLAIGDALLRFSINHVGERPRLFSTAMFIPLLLFIFLTGLAFPALMLIKEQTYVIPFLCLLWLQSLNVIFLQYTRAIGKLMLFSLTGIISAVFLFGSSVMFLKYLRLDVVGYLAAQIVASLVSVSILFIGGGFYRQLNWRLFELSLLKKMLSYSVPLVPNAVMWWVMLMSNRYIIAFFLGATATGLFTVASKIPSVISMFHSTFMQAWHLAAIKNHGEGGNEFFALVFYGYFFLLSLLASGILVVVKPLTFFLFDSAYHQIWQFIPFLLLGIIFLSLASFLEAQYIAEKKTVKLVKTTLIGTLINLVFTILLVLALGMQGAGLAMFLSFLVTWLLRVKETGVWQALTYQWEFFLTTSLLLSFSILISCGYTPSFIFIISYTLLFLIVNFRFIHKVIQFIRKGQSG